MTAKLSNELSSTLHGHDEFEAIDPATGLVFSSRRSVSNSVINESLVISARFQRPTGAGYFKPSDSIGCGPAALRVGMLDGDRVVSVLVLGQWSFRIDGSVRDAQYLDRCGRYWRVRLAFLELASETSRPKSNKRRRF